MLEQAKQNQESYIVLTFLDPTETTLAISYEETKTHIAKKAYTTGVIPAPTDKKQLTKIQAALATRPALHSVLCVLHSTSTVDCRFYSPQKYTVQISGTPRTAKLTITELPIAATQNPTH